MPGGQADAQLKERLSIPIAQLVENGASRRCCQCIEDIGHAVDNRQVRTCLSRLGKSTRDGLGGPLVLTYRRLAGSRIVMRLLHCVLFLFLPLSEGCGACVSIGYPAFLITVRDAQTGQPLIAGTTVVASGTGGADSVTYGDDTPSTETRIILWEGHLNEGRYTVEVRRPGYTTWRRENIRLRSDDCGHPEAAVELTALLSPS